MHIRTSYFKTKKISQEKFRTQHHGPWSAHIWGYGGRAVTGEEGYREGYAARFSVLSILYPYKTNVA
jgi:hypothetical protein